MANEPKGASTVDRVIEKTPQADGLSIAERAAARLAEASPGIVPPPPPPQAPGPAETAAPKPSPPPIPPVSPPAAGQPSSPPPVKPVQPNTPAPNIGPGSQQAVWVGQPGRPDHNDSNTADQVQASDDDLESQGQFIDIDLMELQLKGYVTPHSQRSRIAEEFRVIKRPLLRRAFATGEEVVPNGHVILITSARPGEGKTETTINLAMSLASERELHVLVIDSDAQKAELTYRMGIKSKLGLVDMLLDEDLTLPDVLVRTSIPNLTILPAGTDHPDATELLASPRMIRLTKDIAGRYTDRVIIIDAPPILASTEPGVLAQLVGQIVMVVENGETSREAVEKALPQIGACRDISFVLNKVRYQTTFDRFGGYGYQYHQQQGGMA